MTRPLAVLAVILAAAVAPAAPGPWQRTETRAPCAAFDRLRAPFFDDTHVHTTYSFDAVSGDVRTGRRDAYRFALGEPIGLPPYGASYLTPANPVRFGFCGPGNADCLAQASLVWQDTRDVDGQRNAAVGRHAAPAGVALTVVTGLHHDTGRARSASPAGEACAITPARGIVD